MKDVDGKLIERQDEPDCEVCNKGYYGFKDGWKYNNEAVFKMYCLSKKFGTLPFEGGLLNQPESMNEMFFVLSQIESSIEKRNSQQVLSSLLGGSNGKE